MSCACCTRLWRDPTTEDRDRKRMIRLLVEDVTMLRGEQITFHPRFRGGSQRTVILPNPLRSCERWMADAEVVSRIDELLNTNTFEEIAAILNNAGFRSGKPIGSDMPKKAQGTKLSSTTGYRNHTGLFQRCSVKRKRFAVACPGSIRSGVMPSLIHQTDNSVSPLSPVLPKGGPIVRAYSHR